MVVVEEKDRAAPQNNWKPGIKSLLLGSGPELPAASASSNTTTIKCPECSSQRVWKDGLRYTLYGEIQRYICRNCSYRFSHSDHSEPSEHHQKLHTLILKSKADKPILCRVGATQTKGAKNLVTVETRTMEKAAGATTLDQEALKGLLVRYMAWLEKEGYCSEIEYPKLIRRLAEKGANLMDPEDVKATIMRQKWKNGTKILAIYAYDALTKMLGIQWNMPKLRQEERLPWIPDEKELDTLIATCLSKQMTAFLQTLKETFADPGEALRLRWIDVNPSNNTITINQPVKGHNPRQLRVSSKLIAMLNALPKTSDRIFPRTYRSISDAFRVMRKKIANRLQNPRIRSISLTSFRHWGATMTYHYTRDILLVQKLLGHKRIENTMKYTQLVSFKDDEFDVATATTIEEVKQLAAVGFEKFDELQGIHIYRRPKRFSGDSGINATDRGINLYQASSGDVSRQTPSFFVLRCFVVEFYLARKLEEASP